MKRLFCGILALVLLGGGARAVRADFLMYTFSSTGSGMLGSKGFSNAAFTITSTADTNEISKRGGIIRVPNRTATISVSGLGTATFNIPTINVDNQMSGRVGLSAPVQNLAILFEDNPLFVTYDLSTPIGPILGLPIFDPGAKFATTAGNFTFFQVANVTFQAIAQPVPEPPTFLLVGISSIGVIGWTWRPK